MNLGGIRGLYTMALTSFDHVHQQDVNTHYLLKDECMEKVLSLLLKESEKPEFQKREPYLNKNIQKEV